MLHRGRRVGAVPRRGRSAIARTPDFGALALAGSPEARSVAVLFLLDPKSAVRRAVAGALVEEEAVQRLARRGGEAAQ